MIDFIESDEMFSITEEGKLVANMVSNGPSDEEIPDQTPIADFGDDEEVG